MTPELIAEITNLYARRRNGSLTERDILPYEEAVFEEHGEFLVRIRKDKSLFKKNFETFIGAYEPFGMFGADAVILDVGAHWGYSVVAMRHQGAKAKILSIEALPHNIKQLVHLKEVEHEWYDFAHIAATETPEQLTFYIPAVNGKAVAGLTSTGGTLTAQYADLLASHVTNFPAKVGETDVFQLIICKVLGQQIDQIVADRGLSQLVQAIKMDVEGHEASAIKGARRLIEKQHPLIMIEGGNRDPGVVKELKSLGYEFYELVNSHFVPVSGYSFANDGYWLHPVNLNVYEKAGFLDPAKPKNIKHKGKADAANSWDAKISVINSLYKNVLANKMTKANTLPIELAKLPDVGAFLAVMRNDVSLFDTHFAAFKEDYHPFAMFGDDAIILDVGTHWGYPAVAMRHLGCSAKILSVEPLAANTAQLQFLKEIENGRYDYVKVAAAEKEATVTLFVPNVNGHAITGLAGTRDRLTDDHAIMFAEHVTSYPAEHGKPDVFKMSTVLATSMPLDILVTKKHISKSIQAIKIDIGSSAEGVIKGAKSTITVQKPLIMIAGNSTDKPTEASLIDLGYANYALAEGKLVSATPNPATRALYWLHPSKLDFYRQKGFMGE